MQTALRVESSSEKKGGRNKIRVELRKRQVPLHLIEIGLKEIDDAIYTEVLKELFDKKKESLKLERDSFKKKAKIRNYLLQKGYESELIYELLR